MKLDQKQWPDMLVEQFATRCFVDRLQARLFARVGAEPGYRMTHFVLLLLFECRWFSESWLREL